MTALEVEINQDGRGMEFSVTINEELTINGVSVKCDLKDKHKMDVITGNGKLVIKLRKTDNGAESGMSESDDGNCDARGESKSLQSEDKYEDASNEREEENEPSGLPSESQSGSMVEDGSITYEEWKDLVDKLKDVTLHNSDHENDCASAMGERINSRYEEEEPCSVSQEEPDVNLHDDLNDLDSEAQPGNESMSLTYDEWNRMIDNLDVFNPLYVPDEEHDRVSAMWEQSVNDHSSTSSLEEKKKIFQVGDCRFTHEEAASIVDNFNKLGLISDSDDENDQYRSSTEEEKKVYKIGGCYFTHEEYFSIVDKFNKLDLDSKDKDSGTGNR